MPGTGPRRCRNFCRPAICNPQSAICNLQSAICNLHLIGHETLGWWDGAAWAYILADGLGSVRQAADGAGVVVSVREWTPYGEEVGGWRAGLGYTGEWQDADVGLVYLRARWYAPGVGLFTAPDPFPGVQSEPGSLHPYRYVLGNPVNGADPSGLCVLTGITDCQRFVSEVRCLIEGVREARKCNSWLRAVSEEALVLDLLAWYYSGIPFTWNGLYLGWIPQPTVFRPGDPDRWPVPSWEGSRGFEWNHPINEPETPLGRKMRSQYGFRRPYFNQTHHYFAFLKFAYHIGGPIVQWWHKEREIRDQLQPALDHIPVLRERGEDLVVIKKWYAWIYRESVYDLYIVDEAAQLALLIAFFGIDLIPSCIETRWCARSETDVWSLENDVDRFYFEFPRKYWPAEEYWPGR